MIFPARAGVADTLGFSLVEVLAVTAVIAIMAAIALPGLQTEVEGLRLGQSTRDVQSELQTARLKAVSANTYMRVRFSCPAVSQFRMVERIGTPYVADAGDDTDAQAATRCDPTTYPFKATGPDQNRVTKPNNDGPVRWLQDRVTLTIAGIPDPTHPVVEFWPDGSAHIPGATPWPVAGSTGVVVTLTKGTLTKTVTVTSAGNIQMQR